MSLIPIIWTSLLVVGGIFISILFLSFISYKAKNAGKKAKLNKKVYNRPAPKINVLPKQRQVYRQSVERSRHSQVSQSCNYINKDSHSRHSQEESNIYRQRANQSGRDTRSRRSAPIDRVFEKENHSRQRLTVIKTLHKTPETATLGGSGGFLSGFNVNFDPLRYYDDEY